MSATVSRDLDHWSQAFAVEVRLRRDRLVVTNPGGLYGIAVDRPGRDAVTSARNPRLVTICQHVRSPATGGRVFEALASGIPTIAAALTSQGLLPAEYIDAGIRFRVLPRRSITSPTSPALNQTGLRIYEALAEGARTVAELASALALREPNIRKALRSLRRHGLVQQQGGKGRPTVYRQTAE